MPQVWEGAFGAGQVSKVERLRAKRDDPAAEDHSCDIPWEFLRSPATEVAFGNSYSQFSPITKLPAAAEAEGSFDVGGQFGQVKLAVFGGEDLLHPGDGLINALVLLPEAAEDFDEKAAAATSGVRHAYFGQLRHELFGVGEIALLAADGGTDVVHEFAGEGASRRQRASGPSL